MFGASVGLAFVLWIERKYINFSEKAVWWAQVLKVALGLGIVIGLRLLLKDPLLALCGGHNAAHAIRYFLMVAFGGAVWPLTFRFWGKLGKRRSLPPPDSKHNFNKRPARSFAGRFFDCFR